MNEQTDSRPAKIHTLTIDERKLLDYFAQNNKFWSSIRANYARYKHLTEAQYKSFDAEKSKRGWQLTARQVNGKPVKNDYPKEGPVGCASGEELCLETATVVVGPWGFCEDHAPAAAESLTLWIAEINATKSVVQQTTSTTHEDLYDDGFERL